MATRPRRIPKAEQFVILQRQCEEFEAKALSQGATITFLNQENTTLMKTNRELEQQIEDLSQRLATSKAFALDVIVEAERLKKKIVEVQSLIMVPPNVVDDKCIPVVCEHPDGDGNQD